MGAKNWKTQEDAVLREFYPQHGAAFVAEHVGRTNSGVVARAQVLKIRRCRYWHPEEEAVLRDFYPLHGPTSVAEQLNRTRASVVHRANLLNLLHGRYWRPEEDAVLREFYPTYGAAFVAERLGLTHRSVSYRAMRLKIKCNRDPGSYSCRSAGQTRRRNRWQRGMREIRSVLLSKKKELDHVA